MNTHRLRMNKRSCTSKWSTTVLKLSSNLKISRRGHVLAMLMALKQVCNHPDQYLDGKGPLRGRSGKLRRAEHILDHVVKRGERTFVFTQYRAMGSRLQKHFENATTRSFLFTREHRLNTVKKWFVSFKKTKMHHPKFSYRCAPVEQASI